MDTFALLEEKVRKTAALVRDLRHRNQVLEEELPKLRGRVQELLKALQAAEKGAGTSGEDARRLAAVEQDLKDLRQEREEVRVRIARLMEILDGLE